MPPEEYKGVTTEMETGAGEGPGRDLRAAREARGLSIEYVAKQLRLQDAQIRALESDDFARLAAPIYVCGYLRAYARLLGLQPEPLVAAYQQLGVSSPPPLATVDTVNERQESAMLLDDGKTRRHGLRWMVYSVILIVLGMAYMTFIFRNFVSQQEGSGGRINVVTSTLSDAETELPITSEKTGDASTASITDLGNQAGAQGKAELAAVTPQGQLSTETTATGGEMPVDKPVAAQVKIKVSLSAVANSWVEVNDVNGARLYYDILKAGDVVHLEGAEPVEVLLGYAPGIKVEYNGAPYDKYRVNKEGVAHFKLGKPAGQ